MFSVIKVYLSLEPILMTFILQVSTILTNAELSYLLSGLDCSIKSFGDPKGFCSINRIDP